MKKIIIWTVGLLIIPYTVANAHDVTRFSAITQYSDVPTGITCPGSWYCDYPIVERYSSIPITHPPSNEPVDRHMMIVTEMDNVQTGDILIVEGNIQVSNKEYGTVEFTCRVDLTRDSTSVLSTNTDTENEGLASNNTVIQPETGLNVSPQLYHYRDTNDVIRLPVYRDPTGVNADVTHDLFAGMHHYTFNYSATHIVTATEATEGKKYVGLVCYAQGSKQTEQGDQLAVDTNGHMSVLRLR